jgi:glycosyltransferase involved in cell wall biosynthesis
MFTDIAKPKISVIIPVFNGEKYLLKTLESLRNQDFSSFEVICINDCSTDDSLSILNETAQKDERFKVFTTEENLGIAPKVFNYGLDISNGEYIVYASQDDLFSPDWLRAMHTRAVETDADATIPDLVFYYENPRINDKLLSGIFGKKERVLSSREAFKYSLKWTIPGNALWRSILVKKYKFFDFGMNADEYSSRYLFLHSNKVVFSGGVFYYRQNNPNAITKKFSIKMFDYPYTDFRLWQLSKEFEFDMETQTDLLMRSIRGLMYFGPLAYLPKYRSALPKIKECYAKLEDSNAYDLLQESSYFFKYPIFYKIALKNYFYFMVISFLAFPFRKLKRVWLNIKVG